MNVLYVITRGDEIGGAQIHVRDLSLRLLADGHEVLVAAGGSGRFGDELARRGIPAAVCTNLIRRIDPRRDLLAVRELRGLIRDFAPDLVSTHSSKAGLVGRLAARNAGVPSIFTAHGWAFTEGVRQPQRTIYRTIEQRGARLAKRIICVSEHDRRLGIAAGIAPALLATVHNGMPDVPETLRAQPDAGGPMKIAMIGRVDAQKDHLSLVRAIAGLPEATVSFIGDGPLLPQVEAAVSGLGMRERVNFLGYRADVAEILAAHHVFALASHYEGFPRSTIEAMRGGLPTVVSDVGGAAEAVTEGITGFVVPRGDVQALGERLRTLAEDPAKRAEMGIAARSRYEESFTFDHMYGRTMAIYSEVASGSGP